jgi:hypothetical protein
MSLIGAYRIPRGWTSQIRVDKRPFHLGVFNTEEEAHAAHMQAHDDLLAGRKPKKTGRPHKKFLCSEGINLKGSL